MAEPTSCSAHILVVDDDPRIRQMLTRYFENEGYQVSAVADGQGMRDALRRDAIDIVLLDLILGGGEDGLMLVREVRTSSDMPIIMLSGRDDVVDRIVGLEMGADDYIAKPFHLREVLARLHSVLRRHHAPPPQAIDGEGEDVIRFNGWVLNPRERRLVAPEGTEVALTTGEFDILLVMAKHPGRVFSRDRLMNLTRGRHYEAPDRVIDAQISRLRKKIEAGKHPASLIKSVRGVGYVFTGQASERAS
jgi:two-component system phosphate regulon response regulator OmpR